MNKHRNYGVDLLRLFAMFLVVMLHVLGQGGMLKASEGLNFKIGYLLETFAYCAVNVYAIISGYVGYSSIETKYKYEKFISFWMQVFTWSFSITLIAYLFGFGINKVELVKCAFPILTNKYWYATSYAFLFFVIPFLNKIIRSLDDKKSFVTVLSICFISIYNILPFSADPFRLNGGYSSLWLIILYVLGALLKKYDITAKIKSIYAFIVFMASTLFVWLWYLYFPIDWLRGNLLNYTSIFIVANAVCLLVIFARLPINGIYIPLIKLLSPAAFGIYLIHLNVVVWNKLNGCFAYFATMNAVSMVFNVFVATISIFLGCLVLELIRLQIFKILKIDSKMQMLVRKAIDKFSHYLIS